MVNRATTHLLRQRKIHRLPTHSVTLDNICPLTVYSAIIALFSQVCCAYLVNGWQGGLIKIISKDNLSNSFSVMPWKQKKIEERWVLWTVWNSEVIFQMRIPLLLPLHASLSKTLSNLSFDLVISKSLLPWQNVRCKYAFTALNIKHKVNIYI